MDEQSISQKKIVAGIIENQAFGRDRNPFDLNSSYEFDEVFHHWQPGQDVRSIHCVADLIRAAKHKETKLEIGGKLFGAKGGEAQLFKIKSRDHFNQLVESNARKRKPLRESVDTFVYDSYDDHMGAGQLIGQDYIPLIGGPFSKQLYWTDYIKMHQSSFFAAHHSPVAGRYVKMMNHFTLGRGFRVDCENKQALAIWEAFAKVNNFYRIFKPLALEYSIYGEIMLQWLPKNQAAFRWDVSQDQIPTALIPRIRVVDPSTIWDIITFPEDLTPSGILAYQQIFPTQWQMYTTKDDYGNSVPGTKFIYQQIPARDMMHFKNNVVTNEKRGRSDFFAALTYDKRLRDAINYALVSEMKNAAWCIDTEVDGSPVDVQSYIAAQRALGTIPAAGSEFVHSKKIKRQYASNLHAGSGHASPIFDWCMSYISVQMGIPIAYWGIHLAGQGSSRAGAVVGTEPVTKVFEDRQQDLSQIIVDVSDRLFDELQIKNAKLEVTFPDIITADRSAKLKDLALAQSEGWISRQRAAEIAAKELGIDDFDYETEDAEAEDAPPTPEDTPTLLNHSSIGGEERSKIKKQYRGNP